MVRSIPGLSLTHETSDEAPVLNRSFHRHSSLFFPGFCWHLDAEETEPSIAGAWNNTFLQENFFLVFDVSYGKIMVYEIVCILLP
ncbi:MAG: hypothetical protein D6736_01965 [Nitrospinota bacterium]|nr:MAG: hypothetical protein D6736_01965 [Nitrospinota bacterium]